ncbi:hypothetical protein YC2023_104840 [Brassica napus]
MNACSHGTSSISFGMVRYNIFLEEPENAAANTLHMYKVLTITPYRARMKTFTFSDCFFL